MGKLLRWRGMRKLFVLMAVVMAVAMGLGSWMTPAMAQQTLNLKAVWNPNAEPDMGGYYFFNNQQAGGYKAWRTGNIWGTDETNPLALPLSPTQLLFTISVPDSPTTGTLRFGLKAFDTTGNVSTFTPDALYNYNIDVTPPAVPTGLVISKP